MAPKLIKFHFKHRVTGRTYVVGAYTEEQARDYVSSICGDNELDEWPVEDLPEHLQG